MILVTGFGPYEEDANASEVLVQSFIDCLPGELSGLQARLAFEVIVCAKASREMEHRALEANLSRLLEHYEPELCIFTGQAPLYNKITIERIGINSFMREIIDPNGPVGYWSNLPGTESLRSELENNEIPASFSFYCGQHVCNHILYSSLYSAEKNNLPHKSGFIHIPLLPAQVTRMDRDTPCMTLEMSRKALSLVILHVEELHRQKS